MIHTDEKTGKTIRLVIVEDHRLVAEGLKLLLQGAPDIEVVGTVESRAELLERWSALDASVVLMDFMLPDGSGAEAAAALRAASPDAVVLFLSADESEESLLAAVEASASGYLLKKPGAAIDLCSALGLGAPSSPRFAPA